MKTRLRIGLIGDYSEEVLAHIAIPKALTLAAEVAGCEAEGEWLATPSLGATTDYSAFSGLWCVPGSPYANMEGALSAIRFAREKDLPFLGTCGGFQHALIEYARQVLGKKEADHAESNPSTSLPLLTRLSCSLAGAKGRVRIQDRSRAAVLYQALEAEEEYNCNYGVNPDFQSWFKDHGLRATGWDENGEIRIVELPGHRFFVATLFQPERSALKGNPHPLIAGFLRCAATKD